MAGVFPLQRWAALQIRDHVEESMMSSLYEFCLVAGAQNATDGARECCARQSKKTSCCKACLGISAHGPSQSCQDLVLVARVDDLL